MVKCLKFWIETAGDCTDNVARLKALISCNVYLRLCTSHVICKGLFSRDTVHFLKVVMSEWPLEQFLVPYTQTHDM